MEEHQVEESIDEIQLEYLVYLLKLVVRCCKFEGEPLIMDVDPDVSIDFFSGVSAIPVVGWSPVGRGPLPPAER